MNENLPVVAVLMSTYNGEKYIEEQLDSIFGQQGVKVKLFVRDDGSEDGTIKIIEARAKKYSIELIIDGENVRPGESFLRLVYKYADMPGIEYYAFADQDDIWLDNKLFTAIEAIKKCKSDKAVLYSSNQYLYIDGKNKGNRHKKPQQTDLISHMTKNNIAGCTFVFNKALAELMAMAERPDQRIIKYRLHDAWMMLIAIACGQVIYDDESYMLYRIHQKNTVGIKRESIEKKIGKLKRFFTKRDDANLRMITAQELLRLFGTYISESDRRILRLYADYQNSWKDKMKLAMDSEICDGCLENKTIFKIKTLINFI